MGAGQSNIQYEPPISFDVKFPGKNVIYDVHAMNIFDRAEFIMEDLGELDRHANGQVELWVRVAEGYVPSQGKLEALTRLFSGNKGAQSNPTRIRVIVHIEGHLEHPAKLTPVIQHILKSHHCQAVFADAAAAAIPAVEEGEKRELKLVIYGGHTYQGNPPKTNDRIIPNETAEYYKEENNALRPTTPPNSTGVYLNADESIECRDSQRTTKVWLKTSDGKSILMHDFKNIVSIYKIIVCNESMFVVIFVSESEFGSVFVESTKAVESGMKAKVIYPINMAANDIYYNFFDADAVVFYLTSSVIGVIPANGDFRKIVYYNADAGTWREDRFYVGAHNPFRGKVECIVLRNGYIVFTDGCTGVVYFQGTSKFTQPVSFNREVVKGYTVGELPNGSVLITGGYKSLYRVVKGATLYDIEYETTSIIFNPDNKSVIKASMGGTFRIDGQAALLNISV
jgi:hypothetical protein